MTYNLTKRNRHGLSKLFYVILLIVIIIIAGVGVYYYYTTTTTSQTKDIVETANADGSFTTLVQALTAANLSDTLKGTGPFTVFAPTDATFNSLPTGLLNELLANTTALKQVLLNHVVSGKLMATDVTHKSSVTTLQGQTLPINTSEGAVKIGPATITKTDIACNNGVIHVIDKVLIPPGIMNIVQTAQYYNFSTLITAVQTADLSSTLSGTGPFTVFAPTDAAFAALPAGTLNSLLANQTALTNVLLYHVVSGELLASAVVTNTNLTTLQGGSLMITTTSSGVMVNDANVIKTDVLCSNGVIHVIDKVLIPP
jgi:uncharacterized surface protein with fasciclin (FAS1) repeats